MADAGMMELKSAYVAFRARLENADVTDGMWCASRGVPVDTVRRLEQEHPTLRQEVLVAQRGLYASEFAEVDRALLAKAKAGDTRAAELLYARFENWTSRAAEVAAKRDTKQETFAQCVARMAATKREQPLPPAPVPVDITEGGA